LQYRDKNRHSTTRHCLSKRITAQYFLMQAVVECGKQKIPAARLVSRLPNEQSR
jgi:hypothetical protein